jgi:serine/threonine protein kinase
MIIDANFNIKVVDFGFAVYKKTSSLNDLIGTTGYIAPEILKRTKGYNGCKADMFSAGVIFYIMMTGILPFTENSIKCPFYKMVSIKDYKQYWRYNDGDKYSEDFKTLMMQMFDEDPKARPDVDQLKSNKWLNETIVNSKKIIKEL